MNDAQCRRYAMGQPRDMDVGRSSRVPLTLTLTADGKRHRSMAMQHDIDIDIGESPSNVHRHARSGLGAGLSWAGDLEECRGLGRRWP